MQAAVSGAKSWWTKARRQALMPAVILLCLMTACGGDGGGDTRLAEETGESLSTWYRDSDGDGYGDRGHSVEAASRPAGHVADASDCRDDDATVHPEADEICGDAVDQDCSGADLNCPAPPAPEPLPSWYADTDGDGFGDATEPMEAAQQPAGYVADATDCRDDDPAVHPAAEEICGDGVDQDCSGSDSSCPTPPLSIRFGVITDVHHSNRADAIRRKYSAALAKASHFIDSMHQEAADFVIELGDLVDLVVDGKSPLDNLEEIDAIFTGFDGPAYHVIGNHEFDSLTRSQLLSRLDNTGIPPGETWYSFDRQGLHCIVLDAGHTVAEPHEAFDLIEAGESAWWDWRDAWVPQAQLDWLTADLAASDGPTVVFAHQSLYWDSSGERPDGDDFIVKNAAAVRSLLEADGQVLAVFTGHDHRGEIGIHNDILYVALAGNVGLERDWAEISPTNGLDAVADNPFALVEIALSETQVLSGTSIYRVDVVGNAQQESWAGDLSIMN